MFLLLVKDFTRYLNTFIFLSIKKIPKSKAVAVTVIFGDETFMIQVILLLGLGDILMIQA